MKKAFLKSIRFQVILLYLFILTTTLTVLRLVLYSDFSHMLQVELDAKLRIKAEGVDEAIRTYWQTQKLEMSKEHPESFLFLKKKDDSFEKIAMQLTVEKIQKTSDSPMIVIIYDKKGKLIASSQFIQNISELQKNALVSALRKQVQFDTLDLALSNGPPLSWRAITKPVIEQGRVKYIVQIVASLIPPSKELHQLKKAYFLQIPIILLIAIAGALFLVKVTLSPVNEMVNTLGQINSNTLKLRIKVPQTADEIARLAETFNGMLDELERSFVAQRQIIQDISHELRTPLTILQGEQEIALKKDQTVVEYKNILISNLEEIDKMKHIVSNLLLLAKFDKETALVEMVPVNLNELLYLAVEGMTVFAEAKNIKIKVLEHAPEIMVKGSEHYLKLLFQNILENAIKYTSYKGSVTVDIKKMNSYARIEVTDTGIGIAPQHLPYIFDRFYRVDKVRSSGEGFGLGLSIAKSIADLHKGKITVKSRPNQGSSFYVDLPYLSTKTHEI